MSLNDRTRPRADRGTHLRLVHSGAAPAPANTTGPSARQRIEIVPLPEPSTEAVIAPLAPPMPVRGDRRRLDLVSRPGDEHPRLFCHACARRARIDLVDLTSRRVHLSCDRCYRMWQEQIRAGDPAKLNRGTEARLH